MPFAVSSCVLFLLTIRRRWMPSADNVLIESIRGLVYVLNAKGQTKKAASSQIHRLGRCGHLPSTGKNTPLNPLSRGDHEHEYCTVRAARRTGLPVTLSTAPVTLSTAPVTLSGVEGSERARRTSSCAATEAGRTPWPEGSAKAGSLLRRTFGEDGPALLHYLVPP